MCMLNENNNIYWGKVYTLQKCIYTITQKNKYTIGNLFGLGYKHSSIMETPYKL